MMDGDSRKGNSGGNSEVKRVVSRGVRGSEEEDVEVVRLCVFKG